ncbi:T9SS C-terminal target domain-containing protein [Lutibacter sp. HS1-25]|uniref:LamG-like jellyroll fold domain-containing protein n=1 Tax=Lutibacter sp. HS1-25 TaxID=2485000 RepID=UPI001010713B|nr:LamG-like jellyroll fold domain-containing protein [Lutibacter sp. HS1-25]RXP60900.1 T9SS C-terminal target domain-containing protein [Lutibacter sp. HS1-25]
MQTTNIRQKFLVFLCLFYSSIFFSQDFKIQHIQDDIPNTGGTNTSFVAVSSLTNAFALPTNNRKTHAGRSDLNTGALEGDDMAGARVLTGTGTLSYYREAGSIANNMRFNTDIWEYTGAVGGVNEFIVRGRYSASLDGVNFVNIDVSGAGIVSPNKVVPIITGIMNDDTVDGADSATGIAHLTSSTNLIVRKGTTSNKVIIYITLVEFTGSNWNVLHGDSSSDLATGSITLYDGYDATGTVTNVSDWGNSIILTQSKAETAASGGESEKIRSQWPIMAPGADNQTVDWEFDGSRSATGNTNRHFIHVLNNPDITVTRFTDAIYANGETTIDISSAGLSDLAQSSIIGSFITAGNGTGYAQGFRNYYLKSKTEAAHWCAKDGNSFGVSHNIQIIDLANSIRPGGVAGKIQLWVKANKGVEVTAGNPASESDPVLNWLDNTVNANNAIQTTGANKPIFTESGINFNPMLNFDGVDDIIKTSLLASSADVTAFTVSEGLSASGQKQVLNIADTSGDNILLEFSDATPTFRARMNGSGNSGVVTTTTVANNMPFIANYSLVSNSNSELFINGASVGSATTVTYNAPSPFAAIGGHPSTPSKGWNGGIAEILIFNEKLTPVNKSKVESYLAIKYGITLGVNGTSQDYVDSDNRVIWDQSENVGFNYNVTGIGQDDTSELSQKQSKTINTLDDITIGIKEIAVTNKQNTNNFFGDKTFLIWGHNDGDETSTRTITKDFSAGITGVTTTVSAKAINRTWKMVVTDSVPTVKLSIPKAMVSSAYSTGENYIMIVADDALFTTNVTSATMKDKGSDLEADWYFEGTKYITFGSTPISAEFSRAVSFNRSDMYLSAGNVNNLANTNYTISAWVKRSPGAGKFDVVSKRNYFGENTDLEPGEDKDGYYNHGYAFRINKTNQFRMVWRDPDDTVNQIMQTSATIPENEWHHICATYDSSVGLNGTTSLYIDGYLEDSDDTLNPMNVPSDAHFMIGAAHHIKRQQKLDGSVDEVRVWNVALSGDQIRYIMNQEIIENGALADGKVLPSATTKNEIISIPWANLIAYYPMSRFVFGSVKDESNSGHDASMINYDFVDAQTAPLPYKTIQDGAWDDKNTWLNGNVQYLPGVDSYLDALETIDYNIVQIDHDVTLDNSNTTLIPASRNGNRTVLGLIVNAGGKLQVDGITDISTGTGTGYGITVSHYLKLDGTIDLEGESQLIQTVDSDLDKNSLGVLERDQQGTANKYSYNYWGSPVGATKISKDIAINDYSYILSDVLYSDSNNKVTYVVGYNYDGSVVGTTVKIADYWIWKFANKKAGTYSEWQHMRSTDTIYAGEGFTMKGVGTGNVKTFQNYVFRGLPNNGKITVNVSENNQYLVANPYPSAIDAFKFLADNSPTGTGSLSNGGLYFWQQYKGTSHILAEYEGGYATLNLGGAVPANVPASSISSNKPTLADLKTPGQYIPVGQGFFTESGGAVNANIEFNNSQRIFIKESDERPLDTISIFMKPGSTKSKAAASVKRGDVRPKFRLGFESPQMGHRQILLTIDQNTTDGVDWGYDGEINGLVADDMFWNIQNKKYVIQGLPDANIDREVPLGVIMGKAGIATIKIDDLENVDENVEVYIKDALLGTTTKINNQPFEINLEAGTYVDRFSMVFAPQNTLDLEETILKQGLLVYMDHNTDEIQIKNTTQAVLKSIKLYNSLGQLQQVWNGNLNAPSLTLPINNLATGMYLVQINTTTGSIVKKVIIE